MTEAHEVVVVAFDQFQSLDLAGPVEVLHAATQLGARPPYRITVVTPDGTPVRSESGLELRSDAALGSTGLASEPIGTLLVIGGSGTRALDHDDEFLGALAALAARAERVASVCTGALLLGAAGLLDGHRATTHWAHCDRLAETCPAVEVAPDQIYVRDRDRWTSAGVTAGIDLALAMVEHDHGHVLAHQIAGWLVVFSQRPGGQSQFSAQLRTRPATTPGISELQRWLPEHLDEDLTVDALADRFGFSPRTLARAFRRETGTTPAAYVEELRVQAARALLESTGLTVESVAKQVGLKRAETLHRAFRRRLGTTPDRYRQHFARRTS